MKFVALATAGPAHVLTTAANSNPARPSWYGEGAPGPDV